MSFLDGILSAGKSVVGVFTGNGIIPSLARTALLGLAVNKLSQNATKGSDTSNQNSNIDAGVRLQYNPDAAAKIPVLYGSAFFGGNISDAAMTNANKTMWYCLVLSEKSGNVYSTGAASSYTFNNIYWNNQRIVFNADGITANYTVDSSGIIDRSISELVKIYLYAGGRTAGKLPAGFSGSVPNAETLFPNWTAGTHAMDGLIFALVRVDYNREKNVTGIGEMLFNVTNSLTYPGDVVYDYLSNTRYGAGISTADILTADIAALNTYSQEGVAYDDEGTGAETLADRYQINGLLDTEDPVLQNAEKILSAAASWLSYDTHEGKWGIVINKVADSVASFNDTNILGSISLSGTGLQDLYNSVKVEFPHRELRDSADFYNISVPTSSIPSDWTPFSRNLNEEDKVLPLRYDIINEPVQAQMLGLIELKQSRLDKVIQFQTDFGKYNLKAGDIIDVTNSRFGFTAEKFRIITINEIQDDDGALIMEIVAHQYNVNVYSIADLYRFTRTDEDGIVTIGSIGTPGTPVVSKIEQDSRPRTEISSTAPTGVVEELEFWLTTDVGIPDDANRSYTLIGVKRPVGGGVFSSGTTVTLEYVPNAGNFYVKTRGSNARTVGPYSNISGLVEFAPVQTTDAITADTQAFDSTGGLLGALALIELLTKLSDLFPSGSTGSIFDRIFDIFKDETGVDLVGQAAGGDLVVAADLETKADGTSLGATTSGYDFIGPITATGSGAITVKLKDGTANKDILAWDASAGKWRTISGCISCDFPVEPPIPTPAVPCSLVVAATLPSNNFSIGSLCPPASSVPYTGSYFIKFNIDPGKAEGGAANPAIPLVAPLVKGTGSFKLYGTDGILEQTLPIASCIIHNNVIELPFSNRAPGKDYYIIWEEGIVTSCTCENAAVNNAITWTFSTSEDPATPYQLNQITPTNIPSDGETNDQSVRTDVDFTYSPGNAVCGSTKLIYTFTQKVKKGTGSVTIKDRETGSTVASLSVSGATIAGSGSSWTVDFGSLPSLEKGKYFDVSSPRGILLTDTPSSSTTVCDKTTQTPALPDRKSRQKEWGFLTGDALEVVKVEFCESATGNATQKSNIKITFNKNIKVKSSGTADVTIFGSGLFGGTHQKIDLRGTYDTKKYGDIYSVSGKTLTLNPTKMFKPNSSYYLNIASGAILDAECDVAWEGISDSTTVTWKTDGAEPTPPQGLTYGSVLFDMEYDRPILHGYAKMNIVAADGRLLTQINSRDLAVAIKYNERF